MAFAEKFTGGITEGFAKPGMRSFAERVTQGAETIATGFHAIPGQNANPLKTFPSMHRFKNALGMVVGFAGVKYLGDIVFGRKINGSQYEEIPREKVPAPLRFLHNIVPYNPFSDHPRDQWLKVVHQMLPAVGGAYGAIKGSDLFFAMNGTTEKVNKIMSRAGKLNPIDADKAIAFAQGKVWSVIAGLSAVVSSATGLTGPVYGGSLNPAFLLRNGGKTVGLFGWLTHNVTDKGLGAEKALLDLAKRVGSFSKKLDTAESLGMSRDAVIHKFGSEMAGNVFAPLLKSSQEQKEKLVNYIQRTIEEFYHKGMNPADIEKELVAKVKGVFEGSDIHQYGELLTGGDNGWLGRAAETIGKYTGLGHADAIRQRTSGYQPPTGRA